MTQQACDIMILTWMKFLLLPLLKSTCRFLIHHQCNSAIELFPGTLGQLGAIFTDHNSGSLLVNVKTNKQIWISMELHQFRQVPPKSEQLTRSKSLGVLISSIISRCPVAFRTHFPALIPVEIKESPKANSTGSAECRERGRSKGWIRQKWVGWRFSRWRLMRISMALVLLKILG